jgi:hypothetical protein
VAGLGAVAIVAEVKLPNVNVHFWPRLCENVRERIKL